MSALRNWLVRLRPPAVILIAWSGLWLILCARYGVKLRWADGTIVLPLLLLAALIIVAALTKRAFAVKARQLLVDWMPFVGANFVYENLRQFTGVLRAHPIDASLDRADRWLFHGTSPTLWMSHVQTPLMTDYMALSYNLYFILPLSIIVLLYLRGRRDDFVELSSALVICFYAGFVLYVIFPAGPPRFYAPFASQLAPLHSYFGLLEQTQGRWDALNPVKVYASFPSLHCALATVTLCYALRFDGVVQRYLAAVIAPLVVSLWIATVYLRHHWVVDVFAGQTLGVVGYVTSRALRRLFDSWRNRAVEESPASSGVEQLVLARR